MKRRRQKNNIRYGKKNRGGVKKGSGEVGGKK